MGRGRRRRDPATEKLWRERIDGLERCGLSVREFSREEGISEPSVYFWRKEIARRDAEKHGASSSLPLGSSNASSGARKTPSRSSGRATGGGRVGPFLPVRVIAAGAVDPSGAPVEIVLPRDLRVLVRAGFDPGLLREVIEALTTPWMKPSC